MVNDFIFRAAGPFDTGIIDAISPDNGKFYTEKEMQETIGAKEVDILKVGRGDCLVIDKHQKDSGKLVNYSATGYYCGHCTAFRIIVGDAMLINKTHLL